MTNLSAFELDVLDSIILDYEAPHTITGDLTRDLGRMVTEGEVLQALLSLTGKEFAQAFVHDRSVGRYLPIAHDAATRTLGIWFMATALGINEVEGRGS